jgi:2-methylcitrate dehydratase
MVDIADYAANYSPESKEAIDTARYCFMDTLGCACWPCASRNAQSISGPSFPALLANGARVPGTDWQLDRCRLPLTSAR